MPSYDDRLITRVRRALGSTRLRALLALGMILGVGGVSTLASWTSAATATSGNIQTGTIDLKINSVETFTLSALSMTGMRPGDSNAAVIQIQNYTGGNLPLTFSVTSTSSGDLAEYLRLTASFGGTAAGKCADAITSVNSMPLAVGAEQKITQTDRSLAVSGTASLCVSVQLALGASPALVAGKNATFALNVAAKG